VAAICRNSFSVNEQRQSWLHTPQGVIPKKKFDITAVDWSTRQFESSRWVHWIWLHCWWNRI